MAVGGGSLLRFVSAEECGQVVGVDSVQACGYFQCWECPGLYPSADCLCRDVGCFGCGLDGDELLHCFLLSGMKKGRSVVATTFRA